MENKVGKVDSKQRVLVIGESAESPLAQVALIPRSGEERVVSARVINQNII